MSSKDYYSLLGVHPASSTTQIKAGYRKLSLAVHPDKQPSHLKEAAESLFSEIEKARNVLLDPFQRHIYDSYGAFGLEAIEKNPDQDPHLLNQQIKKMMKKNNRLEWQSYVSPKTSITLKSSCASDVENWLPKLVLESCQLQQSVKLNLGSRLAGDLGFLVYTQDGKGITNLVPRVFWSLGNDYNASLALQVGDRPAGTFSMIKTWEKLTLFLALSKHFAGCVGVMNVKYIFNPLIRSSLTVQMGSSSNCAIKVKRNLGQTEVGIIGNVGAQVIEAGLAVTKTIAKNVKAKSMLGVGNNGVKGRIGFSCKVCSQTRLGSELEATTKDIYFNARLTRAGVDLNLPICLTNSLSLKGAVLGVALFSGMALLSSKLYQRGHQSKYSEIREKKLEESKRMSEEYISTIRDAAESKLETQIAKNGLLILEACYGSKDLNIDVKIVLQFLVEDSELYCPEQSKEDLQGIYNPMMDGHPKLHMRYSFGGVVHERLFLDSEAILLPQTCQY